MSNSYPFLQLEAKWQKIWEENKTFKTLDDTSKPKYYILDMFPYPSGQGLHVGHPEGYTASDIIARYKRMQGFNVLHPMGFDAFGLPAETYALQTGTHPSITTKKNIENFTRQLKMFGFSYDWDRVIDTTDPGYYKWTQWIFLKLFEKGLVYEAETPVWYCPELKSVLANEEVVDGKSERGNYPVERIMLKQWMLKITAYADRLLEGLDSLDWPESVKEMQRNWIGRSEGAELDFSVDGFDDTISVFTTRPDTLFGASYMVLSPEHNLVSKITKEEYKKDMEAYQLKASKKSDLDRTELAKEKSGIFTGAYAINPVNNKRIPIWVADYVLISYGTGAIMAVPGHDQRDYEFAKMFDLEIIEVIEGGDLSTEAYSGNGLHVNSEFLNGLDKPKAITKMLDWLENKKIGKKTINYKLRDWLFSRQRYWGEPIPLYKGSEGKIYSIKEDDLPLKLPEVKNYEPSGHGESPLANIRNWVEFQGDNGNTYYRETHTMPQWAGSNWYYLRYIDPHNDEHLVDPEKEKYWMNVDFYIGGAEHAVLHLMYARFWHKVLFDFGVVSTEEPFQKLLNQGLILGEDGEKMSKSRGNVVNPDDVIKDYGADSLRMYEMFMGPIERAKPWSMSGIGGIHRFLNRVWRLFVSEDGLNPNISDAKPSDNMNRLFHKTVKILTNNLEDARFNTAISQLMIYVNEAYKELALNREHLNQFILLLSPFAPHITSELWNVMGNTDDINYVQWPEYDESLIVEDTFEYPVMINGKMKFKITVDMDSDPETVKSITLSDKRLERFTKDKTIKLIKVIPNKIITIVIK